jgi:hypothetical protein
MEKNGQGPRIYQLQELLGMLKNNTEMSSLAQPPH